MKKDELKQTINMLRSFIKSKSIQVVEDTIELLENEILYHDIKWDNALKDISLVISCYQPLANNHNCMLMYSVFTIADTRYLDIYLNKNGYKCTVLEISEYSKSNIGNKLESILDEKLIELASNINKLIN